MEKKIVQYLTGEASQKTIKSVMEWKEKNPAEYKKWAEAYGTPLFENFKFISPSKIRYEKTISLRTYIGFAASILLLIAIAWFFVPRPSCPKAVEWVEVNNTSPINKEVHLPDGSVLILKPNTSIKYQKDFSREIELTGTAFFTIHKDKAHPFRVYSAYSTIRVLGTEFMVQSLDNKQNIILKEGRVEVLSILNNQKDFLEHYGEMITINSKDKLSAVKTVRCGLYFSWQNEKLNFQHATVAEVVEYLEDCYSIRVEIQDEKAWQTKLIGSAPKEKPELIIQAIAKIINKKIEKKNNKYILK